jgi:hypothetical protein
MVAELSLTQNIIGALFPADKKPIGPPDVIDALDVVAIVSGTMAREERGSVL